MSYNKTWRLERLEIVMNSIVALSGFVGIIAVNVVNLLETGIEDDSGSHSGLALADLASRYSLAEIAGLEGLRCWSGEHTGIFDGREPE